MKAYPWMLQEILFRLGFSRTSLVDHLTSCFYGFELSQKVRQENMKSFKPLQTIVAALAIASCAQLGHSAELSAALEATKSSYVDVFSQLSPSFDSTNNLPGSNRYLSYFAFDLSELPEGTEIISAEIHVFDLEPFIVGTNEMALLDVAGDWTEETLTYQLAMEQYGAALGTDEFGGDVSAFDADKILWFGEAIMDNEDPPGRATINSTRPFLAVDPYTAEELVAELNTRIASGDTIITCAMRGKTTQYHYITGIEYPSENGPTLQVTLAFGGGAGSTIAYNFDNGDLDGWSQILTSDVENGPTALGLISETDPNVDNSVPLLQLSSPSFIGPVPFEAEDGTNTRDQAHETLVVRSPEFKINPTGSIFFALISGSNYLSYRECRRSSRSGIHRYIASCSIFKRALDQSRRHQPGHLADNRVPAVWSRSG